MIGPILREGENCSSLKLIERVSLLVDSDNYYHAVFNAMKKAKKSVDILGWELESDIRLKRVDNLLPDNLREFFKNCVARAKDLKINIFVWKAPFYLFFDRERLANLKWKIRTPASISFREKKHPMVWGSYHEKLVILDGSCAFLGGIDLSIKRWDNSLHSAHNLKRLDRKKHIYHPNHDVQIVCQGRIIDDLRQHFLSITKNREATQKSIGDNWPHENVNKTFQNILGAISLTDSMNKKKEILALYITAIQKAKKFIYIENQYLSHQGLVDEMCKRLKEKDGPEIVIIMPYSYRGRFERGAYLRSRLISLKKLREADQFKRFGMFYPQMKDGGGSAFIVVHSKLLIVDNSFMTLGSANLNYRSMCVDNEMNISFDGILDPSSIPFIKSSFERLITEHLGISNEELNHHLKDDFSLLQFIKSHEGLEDVVEIKPHLSDKFLFLFHSFVDISYPIPRRSIGLIFLFLALLIMVEGFL